MGTPRVRFLAFGLPLVIACTPPAIVIEQSDDDDDATDAATTDDDPTTPPVEDDGPTPTSEGSSSSGTTGGIVAGSSSDSGGSSSGEASSSSSTGYDGSSTSYGSSTSTGYESSSSDSGFSFITFIGETTGDPIECSTFEQDCPEGEKCNPWANDGGNSWNAVGCFPVDPTPSQVGDACQVEGSGVSGIDDCDVGAMCWDVDEETAEGTCIQLCTGSIDDPMCADAGELCNSVNDGVLNICLPACDPLMADCDDGQACYPVDPAFTCAPDASGEFGDYNDPCAFINACSSGLACVSADSLGPSCPAGSTACCTPFCDLDGDDACQPSHECVAWFDEGAAPPGFEDVGVCAVP